MVDILIAGSEGKIETKYIHNNNDNDDKHKSVNNNVNH